MSCYRNSLGLADQLGMTSIAFPAIATGIYGFPAAPAAHIAVNTLRATPTRVTRIRLVAFDTARYDVRGRNVLGCR